MTQNLGKRNLDEGGLQSRRDPQLPGVKSWDDEGRGILPPLSLCGFREEVGSRSVSLYIKGMLQAELSAISKYQGGAVSPEAASF